MTQLLRIHVTGASGSGTSTLSAALAAALNGAHLDADDYYWLPTTPPFTSRRDPTQRLALLLGDLRASKVAVLAGSVAGWGQELEDCFDLIVFLYLDAPARLARLRHREAQRFGQANPAFLEWAAQYDDGVLPGRSLQRQRDWLAARRGPHIELSSDAPVQNLVAAVMRALPGF
ncbi:adenylate kinase [Acidovorax sp. A79]|uniref:hypothetical protein n=1 Tax=unclassified Acidovorax TaxID=2684926 RepID=UPI0021067738|nr:hypothetical protein [Acidovorax sp. sif1233]